MPNGQNLRILLQASLNVGSSIGEINKRIKEISRHPSLRAINLKVNIEKGLMNSLNNLNNSLNQIAKSMNLITGADSKMGSSVRQTTQEIKNQTNAIDEQNRAIKENDGLRKKVTEYPDGLIKTDTTTGDRFYQRTESEWTHADGVTKVDKESPIVEVWDNAKLREAEKNFERFSENVQSRIREINKAIGNNNKLTRELKNEYASLTPRSDPSDFKYFEQRLKELEKYADAQKKAQEQLDDITRDIGKKTNQDLLRDEQRRADLAQKARLKEYEDNVRLIEKQKKIEQGYIKDVDQAWHEAYKEKEKREEYLHGKRVQDTWRAYELAEQEDRQFNQKRYIREQEFARQQQNTINKIEAARLKYGHHPGMQQKLDALVFDAKSIKSTDDFNNGLKNINTTLGTTTSGLKAAKQQSLAFGEALSTALVKFPINYPGGSKTSLIAGTPLEPWKLQREDEICLSVNAA